jgi:hypothetical protein
MGEKKRLSRGEFIKVSGLAGAAALIATWLGVSFGTSGCGTPQSEGGAGKGKELNGYTEGKFFLGAPWREGASSTLLPTDVFSANLQAAANATIPFNESMSLILLPDSSIRARWTQDPTKPEEISSALIDSKGGIIGLSPKEYEVKRNAWYSPQQETYTTLDASGVHQAEFKSPDVWVKETGVDKTLVEIDLPEDLSWAYTDIGPDGNRKADIGCNAFVFNLLSIVATNQYAMEGNIRKITGNTSNPLTPVEVQQIVDQRGRLISNLIDPSVDRATKMAYFETSLFPAMGMMFDANARTATEQLLSYFDQFTPSDIRTGQQLLTVLSVLSAIDNQYAFNPSSDKDLGKKLRYQGALKALAEKAPGLVMMREKMKPKLPEAWIEVPQIKPRVFKIRKQYKKVETKKDPDTQQNVSTTTYEYQDEIVFMTPQGKTTSATSWKKSTPEELNKEKQVIPQEVLVHKEREELIAEGFTNDAFPTSEDQTIIDINEVNPESVRLYSKASSGVPFTGQSFMWGFETVDSKNEAGKFEQRLMTDHYNVGSLGHFESSSDNYWLTDITEFRKKWIAEGTQQVFGTGLLSPKELMRRMGNGLLQPTESSAKDVLTNIWAQNDFGNKDAAYKKCFVMNDTLPIFSDMGGTMMQQAILRRGDYFSFDRTAVKNINGVDTTCIELGNSLYVPLSNVRDLMIYDTNTFQQVTGAFTAILPWILYGISEGPTIAQNIVKIISRFT